MRTVKVALAILIVCALLSPVSALSIRLVKTGFENGYYHIAIVVKGDGKPLTISLTYYIFENGKYMAKYSQTYSVGRALEYCDHIT